MTGLGGRRAMFMVTEPGQPPVYFSLWEATQNAWLEVLSVDLANGTVKARLKRPVVRIRSVGAEVVLSFAAHGVQPPPVTVAANPLPASLRR